jgi:integrase
MGKKWFVYFSVTNLETGQTVRKQIRGEIKAGKAELAIWQTALKRGWSPFESTLVNKLANMSFTEALDFALSKCSVAKKTKSCYSTAVKFAKAAAEKLDIELEPIRQITRQHIKLILERAHKSNKWTNLSYNKYLGYLKAVLNQLIEWEVIEHNPAGKIKTLPVAETQKYIPYTDDEKKRIQEYIFLYHYRYWVVLMVTFHTGIRPKEVLALRIKDVDLNRALITIIPDLEEENSKTKKIRKVPVNNHLLSFLRELQLQNYPSDYYIFGSPYPAGQGNRGSAKGQLTGAMHPDYFKPSTTRIKRDTITKLWKKIVIDHLGIEKYQYAMKHTGANDKIMAGMDLSVLQELYGHSSKLMTMKYASAVKDVYRSEIIEKSPEF